MDPSTSFSLRLSAPVMKEYVLTEKLGRGTFASVYKAYRKVWGRGHVILQHR